AALVAVSYPDAEDILVPVTQAGGSIVPVFQEGWEDYDGDISLSGWTIQKDDTSSITWGLTDYWGGWYGDLAPTSGKYMALIEYEESAGGILPQDQWLISPAFTVKNHNSFYFDYAHAPIWMYYGPIDLEFDNPMITLKAKISVDHGATWTELFDAFENNKGRYDDDNIFDYLTPIWETITVDLTAYAGKTVKIAFHSFGVFPDCNFIDNVSVGIQKEFANPPVRSSVQKNLGLSFSGKNGISFEKKAGKTVKKFID
ncbi:MAG: choice-of-anchor J domain-containing protein, partial [Proteiniphilum sp.]|nr:choice-of-anchor J domain-containing protein [Proteiniphilum sp.]